MEAKKKIFLVIAILAVVFRLVNYEKAFFFAHDQDLYSWIAKDIIVNGHNRLVGQVTSVDGVFIGSFYYYLMAVFYWMFGMNPLSAVIPVTIIGVFNAWSFYWITNRHFGKKAGWVAMFIYAVSFGIARFDRWSVPTQPTLTWSIWFAEVILELIKGNLKVLPLYGFLCAFVWQLHIALIPVLPIPIVAYFAGGNKIALLWNKKWLTNTILSILIFLACFSPFLMFEFKHDFSQVKSMVAANKKDIGAPTGKIKLFKIIDASGREFQQRLFFGNKAENVQIYWLLLIVSVGSLYYRKRLGKEEIVMFGMWYGLIMLAQFASKRVVSEYYFTNLVPIYVLVLAVFLSDMLDKKILYGLGGVYLAVNTYWLFTKTDEDQSYLYHRQIVEFVKSDVVKNNYPCVAINFISDPGVGVGFRYLWWYNKIEVVKPGTPDVPVYNISIPWQLTEKENSTHFGRFGVIVPPAKNNNFAEVCRRPEYQLDPLLGYTE